MGKQSKAAAASLEVAATTTLGVCIYESELTVGELNTFILKP